MFDKEFYRNEAKRQFSTWTDEQIEYYVNKMADRYATVKRGPNVIHLDYYDGILNSRDIEKIENDLMGLGYQLSRFNKAGVAYNSLQDYTLQLAYYISDPIVQSILLGLGTNVLWDALKKIIIYTWKRIRLKEGTNIKGHQNTFNFGLKLRIGTDTKLDLKLDRQASEETTLKALDKVIDLIKETKLNEQSEPAKLFIFKDSDGKWVEIDVLKEITEKHIKKN